MGINCTVLGPNENGPGRTEKKLPPLLPWCPLEQRDPLVSPRFYHLEVSQEVEVIKEPEHGVPMRTPLRHGSRWTRGQRTIMPGSVEDMSVYVSHASHSGGSVSAYARSTGRFGLWWSHDLSGTHRLTVRTNSGHTYVLSAGSDRVSRSHPWGYFGIFW